MFGLERNGDEGEKSVDPAAAHSDYELMVQAEELGVRTPDLIKVRAAAYQHMRDVLGVAPKPERPAAGEKSSPSPAPLRVATFDVEGPSYFRSPTASRASSTLRYSRPRTTFPSRTVLTTA